MLKRGICHAISAVALIMYGSYNLIEDWMPKITKMSKAKPKVGKVVSAKVRRNKW